MRVTQWHVDKRPGFLLLQPFAGREAKGLQSICSMKDSRSLNKSDQAKQGKRYYRAMTVAQIREQKGADHVEVVFLESARIYRLPRKNPAYDEALTLLRDALANHRVLQVGLASLDSDIIEEIQEPGSGS